MARKRLRILHLTHPSYLPPESEKGYSEEERNVWQTDYDVVTALRGLDHEVLSLGVLDELLPIREAIESFQPDLVFNLLEEFAGLPEFDQHVVAYLELLDVPYTGCNPRGLTLARGKALSKKVATYHRIPTPGFAVFPRGRKVQRPRRLDFPVIVKGLMDESSRGIAQASVVTNDEKLAERVAFIHARLETDAIAEQFIEGRELYVGVVGNERLKVLPVWELDFGDSPNPTQQVATEKLKHDVAYQKRRKISHGPARDLPDGVAERLTRASRRIYKMLSLDGYARIDFRLDAEGRIFFLEANPNSEIAREEELASAAKAAGLDYPALIQKVLNLGQARRYRS